MQDGANTLYDKCGGKKVTFPQRTIYDSLRAHNVSFGLYMNSTCGLDGKPCHGESQHDPDSASAINTPDVAMEGVARHQDRFYSQTLFYERAANGTLPSLSWILPPQQACDHPCHDIAKGERLLKDVYEALRAPDRSGSARCSSSRTTTPAATTTTWCRRTRASPPTSRRASSPASTPSAARFSTSAGSGCGRRRC